MVSKSTNSVTVHLGDDAKPSILETNYPDGSAEPFAIIRLANVDLIARDADALASLAQACTRALIDLRKAYEKGPTA